MLISVKIPLIFSSILKSVAKNDYWHRHVCPSVCLSPEMEERDSYQKDILLMSSFGILIKISLRFLWGMSWGRGKSWPYKHETYDLLWTWMAVFEINTRNTISCWIDKVTKKCTIDLSPLHSAPFLPRVWAHVALFRETTLNITQR